MMNNIESYKKAIELNPGYGEPYKNIGVLYYEAGDYAEAAENLRRAISLGVNDGSAKYYLGLSYFAQSALKEATEALKSALSLSGKDTLKADANFYLGLIHIDTRMEAEAIKYFEAAITLEPSHVDALKELAFLKNTGGDIYGAIELYNRIMGLLFSPVEKSKVQTQIASCFLSLYFRKEAVLSAEKAVSFDANNPEAFAVAGVCYFKSNLLDKAINALEKSISLDPSNEIVLNVLAKSRSRRDETVRAISLCRENLKNDPANIKQRILLSSKLLAIGSYKEAEDELNKVIRFEPYEPSANDMLGRAGELLGNKKEAAFYYRSAIKFGLVQPGDYVLLASICAERDLFEEAVKNYAKILSSGGAKPSPLSFTGLIALAQAYIDSGATDDAVVEYEKALKLDPSDERIYPGLGRAYLSKNQYDKAMEIYRRAGDLNTGSATSTYESLARSYVTKGLYDEAVITCEKAKQTDKDNPVLYVVSGEAYLRNNKFAEAMAEFTKALELDPENDEANGGVAEIYLNRREFEKAVEHAEKAVGHNEAESRYYYILCQAYQATGMSSKVKDINKRVCEMNPNYGEVNIELGLAFDNKELVEEAITGFKRDIAADPGNAAAHRSLGLIFAMKGLYDEAVYYYKKALKISEDDPKAHYYLGLSYEMQNKNKEAITSFSRAVDLRPESEKYIFALISAYEKENLTHEIIALCRKVNEASPNSIPAQLLLAKTYVKLENFQEAVDACKKIVEIAPKEPEAYNIMSQGYLALGNASGAFECFELLEKLQARVSILKSTIDAVEAMMKNKVIDDPTKWFRIFIKLDPDNSSASVYLGDVYFNNGQKAEALKMYERTFKLEPDNKEVIFRLAVLYFEAGKLEAGVAMAAKIGDLESIGAESRFRLYFAWGTALNQAGKFSEAENYFKKCEAEEAVAPGAFSEGKVLEILYLIADTSRAADRIEDTISYLEKIASTSSKETRAFNELAELYIAKNDGESITRALEYAARTLRINDDDETANALMARGYLASGKNEKGAEYLEKVASKNPEKTEVRVQLGHAYESLGKFEKAFEHYRQALDSDPSVKNVALGAGRCLAALGKYTDALMYLLAGVKEGGNGAELFTLIGECYLKTGMNDKSAEAFRKAITMEKNSARAYFGLGLACRGNNDASGAEVAFGEAVKLSPDNFEYSLEYVNELVKAKKYEAASTTAEELVKLDPGSAKGYYLSGLINFEFGNITKSLKYLEQALALDINNVPAYRLMARAYKRGNDIDSAIEMYRQALLKDGNGPELVLEACGVFLESKLYGDVIDAAGVLSKQYPALEAPLLMLAKAYSGKEMKDELLSVYDKLASLGTKEVTPYLELARNFISTGDNAGAVKMAGKAVELDPLGMEANMIVAKAAFAGKSFDTAISAAQKASEIDPKSLEPKLILAKAYEASDRLDDAIEVGKKIIELDKDNYSAHTIVGMVYNDRGSYERALFHLQTAFKLNPEDPDLIQALALTYYRKKLYYSAIPLLEKLLQVDGKGEEPYNLLIDCYEAKGEAAEADKVRVKMASRENRQI